MSEALPTNPEELQEQIDVDHYKIHEIYTGKLKPFLERADFPPIGINTFAAALLGPLVEPQPLLPPKPKRKFSLCKTIGEYASALLSVELHYSTRLKNDPDAAVKRLEQLVMQRAKEIGGIHFTLLYHATEEEISNAALRGMQTFLNLLSGVSPPPGYQPPSLGKYLKALRTEAKLTVRELAGLVKLTPRTVFRHESDSAKIRSNNADAYGRVLSEILKRPISIKKSH